MNGVEETESIKRRIQVASVLIRQATALIEKSQISYPTPDHTPNSAIDSELIAELQLSTSALRRAWAGANQT